MVWYFLVHDLLARTSEMLEFFDFLRPSNGAAAARSSQHRLCPAFGRAQTMRTVRLAKWRCGRTNIIACGVKLTGDPASKKHEEIG
jgi:hypothetical protein